MVDEAVISALENAAKAAVAAGHQPVDAISLVSRLFNLFPPAPANAVAPTSAPDHPFVPPFETHPPEKK